MCADIVGANILAVWLFRLGSQMLASTQNIVLLVPLWRQDSERAQNQKAAKERVRQRRERELNEVEEQQTTAAQE